MANEEQLAILRQGVEVWNKWRKEKSDSPIDLSRIEIVRADLSRIDLRTANLMHANLSGANLRGSIFNSAILTNINLLEADLTNANLEACNLSGASLRGGTLSDTNLKLANLSDADFSEANLDGTNFERSKLSLTVFGSNDLSKCKNLEAIEHYASSYLGVETIHKSKGRIPEVFLRGCGLSDLDIEYAKLATPGLDSEQVTDIAYEIHQLYVKRGIQYYSCFISYNRKDEEFAKRLHDDLQDNGVRCWFAPEDMKIGDQIRSRIDQEIRLRDKLLVILSENSVKSEWVGDEVEAALEEENKSNRLVLFPIRLDDAVMSTRDDWAAKIKRRRHIGDFSNWKDKANYQKAFERLLRDLKATGGQVNGE